MAHDFPPAPPGDAPGTTWRAWHLHTASPARSLHDRVVTEVVSPVVATLPGRPWFFIRYWHAGPHVRLRIGDLDASEAERVEAALTEGLGAAGRLRDDETPIGADAHRAVAARLALGEGIPGSDPGVREMLPPGVHRAVYEPELERYGGARLMPASEHLFRLSSELIAAFLRRAPSTGARAGLALRAVLVAGHALEDPEDEAAFHHFGLAAWRSRVIDAGHPPDRVDRLCGAAVTAERERPRPAPAGDPGDRSPLTPWYRALVSLVRAARELSPGHPGQLVSSHVHMLHNRLGLGMAEELQTYARSAQMFPSPTPAPEDLLGHLPTHRPGDDPPRGTDTSESTPRPTEHAGSRTGAFSSSQEQR
ncbi:thiopeptide-type bacteriocin biosynthesis protein [Streptomyces sp. ST2-7A]|nr:thiopeptide-type bacteriocin biosynthesis protein [Streptomyces sp. ST2-7A]